MMNKDKLKSLVSKRAKSDSSKSLQLYQMFFFERILRRLSVSEYANHIILKGGLLLASIIGFDERTTKDMDAVIKGIPLEKEFVENMINEILTMDLGDGISFLITSIEDIRNDDEYGGFRIMIEATLDDMRLYLAIELSAGDVITPREIKYRYNCIFEEGAIPILAYTIETSLAEKFHALVVRGTLNTRMKDFYDIYILINSSKEVIDFTNLAPAIRNTFKNRETKIDLELIKIDLGEMQQSSRMSRLWSNYQKTATYAQDIEYVDLFKAIYRIVELLEQ